MKGKLFINLMLALFVLSLFFSQKSSAAEFHVTTAVEFQAALDAAETNGEDDSIYLAAGTYQGNFSYFPPNTEHKSLRIMAEPGLYAEDVILDGMDSGVVLRMSDGSDGPVAEILIERLTIQNGRNAAGCAGGAGILPILYSYNICIAHCIIKNNTTIWSGGGIHLSTHQNVTIKNNIIVNNTVNEDSSGISLGGGVNILQGQSVNFISNTISSNRAKRGGGVKFSAGIGNSVAFYNNIIYANTAEEGGDIFSEGWGVKIGYNNNYSDMLGTWTESGNNLNVDPRFVDPANYDFHLQPASPMINAGTATVPDPPGLPATDIEGTPRILDSAPDIGAYESYESSPIIPTRGTYGTEITIYGSGFGTTKGKVSIGTVALKVLEWTDTFIHCILNKNLVPETYEVTVRRKKATEILFEDAFTVEAPEMDSVNPTSGSTGEEITINGLFFGTKKGKVTLGGKNCKVLSWEMDPITGESEVRFIVPKGLTPGLYELKVTNRMGEDILSFTVE